MFFRIKYDFYDDFLVFRPGMTSGRTKGIAPSITSTIYILNGRNPLFGSNFHLAHYKVSIRQIYELSFK